MKPKEPVQINLCERPMSQRFAPESFSHPEGSRVVRSLQEFAFLRFDGNGRVVNGSESVWVVTPSGWKRAEAVGAYSVPPGADKVNAVTVRMESGSEFPVTSAESILWA